MPRARRSRKGSSWREDSRLLPLKRDWPDAYRVNRFVVGRSDDRSSEEALSAFTRFPVWMWRNRVVANFIDWLRDYNHSRPMHTPQVGFYGLDLYSLGRSREEVVRYLETVDPKAAGQARYRYSCFDHFGEDEQAYGYAAAINVSQSCQDEVIQQLKDLRTRAGDYSHLDGHPAEDEFFSAEQNARLVQNAEQYYRGMFESRVNTWNIRDKHMTETLEALADHLAKRYGRAKIVVWAHNTHVGNARATDRARYGEWNVGQLVRQSHSDAVLVGFTTYTGTVTAATFWGDQHETKKVRPALTDSYEAVLHDAGADNFLITFAGDERLASEFRKERLERAIGVIYRPESERVSHYFKARLADQFDAVLHFDRTRALEPLPGIEEERTSEPPDTFPAGL